MNRVAKEYVAAQDPNDPGVLVLSRFASSGKQMQAALIVNPYETEGVAERLQTARHMSVEERRERYRELMQGLVESTVARWSEDFLRALVRSEAHTSETQTILRISYYVYILK